MLENSIHDLPAIPADNILTSLSVVLDNVTTLGVDPDEELDQKKMNEVAAMTECDLSCEEEETTTLTAEEESAVVNGDESLP